MSKRCNNCGEEKSIEDFYFKRGCCKVCSLIKRKEHYENNREHVLEVNKAYVKMNPERMKVVNRQKMFNYYQSHKQGQRARRNQYHQENKVRENAANQNRYRSYIDNVSDVWLNKLARDMGFTKIMLIENPDILEIIKYSVKIKRYGRTKENQGSC